MAIHMLAAGLAHGGACRFNARHVDATWKPARRPTWGAIVTTAARSSPSMAHASVGSASACGWRCAQFAEPFGGGAPRGGGWLGMKRGGDVGRRELVLARAASEDDDVEDWEKLFAGLKPVAPELPKHQVTILEKALARGRRQVSIQALVRELDMPREDVLAWMKANKSRQAELARLYPPEPERVAVVRLDRDDQSGYDDDRDKPYDAQTAYLRNAPNAREGPHVPKGAPAYKGFAKKRLGARNVATLEKVYAQVRFPDDSMLESVHRATKLPRSKIVAWFKTKREEEQMEKRRAARDARYERDGDGFYGRTEGRGGRGVIEGSREGRRRRDGPGGGLRGDEDSGMPGGSNGDVYGLSKQAHGKRDSTSGWSSARD